MKAILQGLMFLAFLLFGAAQLVAARAGIEHHVGGFWAILIIALAFFFRFPLPITIGAFFGAMEVWDWHWAVAATFAAPGLLLMIPQFLAAVLGMLREQWLRNRAKPVIPETVIPLDSEHGVPGAGHAGTPEATGTVGLGSASRAAGWIIAGVLGVAVGLIVGVLVASGNFESQRPIAPSPLVAAGSESEPVVAQSVEPVASSPAVESSAAEMAGRSIDASRLDVQPIELGRLVNQFMLDDGQEPAWTLVADRGSPVKWTIDGVAERSSEIASYREGLARVSVDGVSKSVVRRQVQEVPWQVVLGSRLQPRVGPQFVQISPHVDCFGSTGSGCDFQIEATLADAGISAQPLCNDGGAGYANVVYALDAAGKQRAWLQYSASAGSGGESDWVTVYWRTEDFSSDVRTCLAAGAADGSVGPSAGAGPTASQTIGPTVPFTSKGEASEGAAAGDLPESPPMEPMADQGTVSGRFTPGR